MTKASIARRLLLCGFVTLTTANALHAQVGPTSSADIVCTAVVDSIDLHPQVRVWTGGAQHTDDLPSTLILHLKVEDALVGTPNANITVLASRQGLIDQGFTFSEEPAMRVEFRKRSPLNNGRPRGTRPLEGSRALFQLQERSSDGGFFLSDADRVRKKFPESLGKPSFIDAQGADYSLSWLTDRAMTGIVSCGHYAFDHTLPDRLRLLDWLASAAISNDSFAMGARSSLRQWNPKFWKRDFSDGENLLSRVPAPTIYQWFQKRFNDDRLTPSQRDDLDILCLRADWGDAPAYASFKKRVLSIGKLTSSLWQPRVQDPEFWQALLEMGQSPEEVRMLFAQLANAPEAIRKTLVLARRYLGLDEDADIGILECVYSLTKDPKVNPSDDQGLRTDLTSQRQAALAAIDKLLKN